MAPRSLPALDLVVPSRLADLASGLLWAAGSTGIEERDGGRLRAHFDQAPPSALLDRLRAAGASSVRRVRVTVEDWVAMGRARVHAVRVGRVLVRPPWSRARPRAGELAIVIDPARAFGTGNHESTRLALAELQARGCRGSRVLDVGCGSGVLSLAALALGARSVLAVDIDPESVAATRENAARNGLTSGLEVRCLGAGDLRLRFDVVLANLTADILCAHAAAIAARVAPRGVLVTAGFLASDRERVGECFQTAALVVRHTRAEGEWTAVSFGRGGPVARA